MNKAQEYFQGDELAASVWMNKYAIEGEETPEDMHKRLAKQFYRIEDKYKESDTKVRDERLNDLSEYGRTRDFMTETQIYNLFKDFKKIIPQGSIMAQLGSPSIGSLSNCFVLGQPVDSYGGIFQKEQEMIQLMKRRGGVGIDISTLRPEGTVTTNAAKTSTGAVSFMHRYSNGTREVAQKGRRGALMLSIDVRHPDSLQFIEIKRDLSQVTGANISLKLEGDFMQAVLANKDILLRFPCEADVSALTEFEDFPYNELVELKEHHIERVRTGVRYIKKIKARECWDEIIKSAHNVAEPGLMFWENMVNYSPDGVYPQFKQVTTNPCSEIGMQPYDACRLIAVSLFSYVKNAWTTEAYFDFDEFYKDNYEAMRLSDALIDLELEHIERIINKILLDPEDLEVKYTELRLWNKVKETAMASRRTGLGITALGDTLAALGLKYDSDESISVVDKIMHTKMESELDCTIDLAVLRGTFQGWDSKLEFADTNIGMNPFYDFIAKEFPKQAERMVKWGRRNVSWSTVAPTGSLSIMAKLLKYSNVASGMEPIFMAFYMRRKKVVKDDPNSRVDFTDQNGDTWQEYPIIMAGFREWLEFVRDGKPIDDLDKDALQSLFEKSPYYGSTANDIDWVKRVEMQATIQKYITHSISSTINLPSTVTEAEVSEIYLQSYKQGLKGITVYRDGSRSGVLVSSTEVKSVGFEYKDAVKRPVELDAEMYKVKVKGSTFTIIVGLLEGKPYEVFGFDYLVEDPKIKVGKIVKKGKGKYYFNGMEISSEMTDEQAAITRLLSTSLRHGADIKFIVEQLNKTDGELFSFTKGLARILKKYIPEGAKSTVSCLDCGSENVIFQEGCQSCQDCGSSACS